MIREGFVAAAALGGALAACTETPSLPDHIQAVKAEYTNAVGCPVDPDIKLADIGQSEGQIKGAQPGETLGYTTKGNYVVLDKAVTEERPEIMRHVLLHEMAHVCIEGFETFDRTYELGGDITATGASGFNIYFDGADRSSDNYFPYIEEGFAEWAASAKFADYEPSTNWSYAATHSLTTILIDRAGISEDEVIKIHEKSNPIGFIAALMDKDQSQVTSEDVSGFVAIYQQAGEDFIVPYDQELEAMGF